MPGYLRSVYSMLALAILIAAAAGVFAPRRVSAATLTFFVDASVSASGDGTSWEEAFKTLQEALAAADGSDGADQIWVANGTYTPGAARTDSFALEFEVSMYGGFAGGESLLTERDPAVNVTILSGEIGAAGNADNSYHVVLSPNSSLSSATVLDGFTVTGGNANGLSPDNRGGGLLSKDAGFPTIVNVIFSQNSAELGGAVATISGGGARLVDVTISENNATSEGGGVHAGSSAQLTRVLIDDNDAPNGAGIYSVATPNIDDSTISNNTATARGGGAFIASGGTFNRVLFQGNSATTSGGGVYTLAPSPTFTNVTFSGNTTAGKGGAIHVDGGAPLFRHATLSGNNATLGGAVHVSLGTPIIEASILWNPLTNEVAWIGGSLTIAESVVRVGCPGGIVTCISVLFLDPLLGALADNGGPTMTFALGPTSPAIDLAPSSPTLVDQRGAVRPKDGPDGNVTPTPDMGAYEYFFPTVAFDTAFSTDGEAATPAPIGVVLSEAYVEDVTVHYDAADDTAEGDGVDYTLASGTLTIPAGQTTGTIEAAINDDTLDEQDEGFAVTISNPLHASLGANTVHSRTIDDNDDPPTVGFAAAASNGSEATTAPVVNVTLSGASGKAITVDFAPTGGSATDGTDFTLVSGTLTFDPGETSQPLPLAVTNDAVDEPNETVEATLSSPSNATAGTTLHTYTINDNDPTPTVGFAASSSNGAESTASPVINVVLSGASASTVTVNYSATGGTATGAGTDYTLASGTLTFTPGDVSESISLAVVNDTLDEANETVLVGLSSPSNATLGTTPHTYTINDTDPTPTVAFVASTSSAAESSGSASFSVARTGATALTVEVDYAVTGGTAGSADFVLASGTLTFAPGDGAEVITAGIVKDYLVEAAETLVVTLANAQNATLGANATHTHTIANDDVGKCAGKKATFAGGPGNDMINGTAGPDVIAGNGGTDTIRGLAGDDLLCGNAGDDRLLGGPGNDTILGAGGRDRANGGGGNDDVRGGGTGDDLKGDGGNDKVDGGGGDDIADGGGGDDRVVGGGGSDEVRGRGGKDDVRGGGGDDELAGEAGNDRCDGGPGVDAFLIVVHGCEVVAGIP